MAATKAAPDVKTFKELTDKLPFSAQTPNGRGFLPPFLRSVGHLLYGLSKVVDSKAKERFDFIKVEVKDAIEHIRATEVNASLSKSAQEDLINFTLALEAYQREFDTFEEQTKIDNLRTLVNKAMGIGAKLDRELVGIRNSDPGSAL